MHRIATPCTLFELVRMVQIMGKIYELLRKLNDEELNGEYVKNDKFISFFEFLTQLQYFADDDYTVISNYLRNINDLMTLDYYYNGKYYYYQDDERFIKYNFDGSSPQGDECNDYIDDDMIDCSQIEYKLEEISEKNCIYDEDYHLCRFWLIEDLLKIEELRVLGLDESFYINSYEEIDFKEYEKLQQENKELLKRIGYLRANHADIEISCLLSEIKALEEKLKLKDSEINKLEKQIPKTFDSDLDNLSEQEIIKNAKRITNIENIIFALVELSNKDNSSPTSQKSPSLNSEITQILSDNGLANNYQTTGYWLAKANNIKDSVSRKKVK